MKKFKNRIVLIVGIILLATLYSVAIFAAGQYFQILPHPEYIGIGCIAGIILMIIGIIIGINVNNKSD